MLKLSDLHQSSRRCHAMRRSAAPAGTTICVIAAALALHWSHSAAAETGDPSQGARGFRACAPCHSREPNRNMTGPSLADLFGRRAASVIGFERYSPALKSADIVWDDKTLDAWLADPAAFLPGNRMTFAGIPNAKTRADLIAFLKEASAPPRNASPSAAQQGGMDGMMGGASEVPSLKALGPDDQVTAVSYCRDTYRVTTADGETHAFWERNLRFKTDSSADGPAKGAPAIVGAGMMGDRASVIFAAPEEISGFIKHAC